MLKPSSAIMGAGLGNDVALLTDGRFSGGSHGFLIGKLASLKTNINLNFKATLCQKLKKEVVLH